MPILLERGILGYESDTLLENENRILREPLHALLVASALIGIHKHAVDRGLDFDRVEEALIRSVSEIKEINSAESLLALALVNKFRTFSIIRENHTFDDWLCEALWATFQSSSYRYPSVMSNALAYALNIDKSLQKCTLEY